MHAGIDRSSSAVERVRAKAFEGPVRGDFFHDVRHAVRMLARNAASTLACVACLAIGIGANATMFGLVDAVLLQPPTGVQGSDRLRRLYVERSYPGFGATSAITMSYPAFTDLAAGSRAFSGVAAYASDNVAASTKAGGRFLTISYVSENYFRLLGVAPALGRFFAADETHERGSWNVVVLGFETWRTLFRGDSGVLGASMRLGNRSFIVVGVAARDFQGVDVGPVGAWIPLSAAPSQEFAAGRIRDRGVALLNVVARLRPGVSQAAASRDATIVYRLGSATDDDADATARVILASILPHLGARRSSVAQITLGLAGMSLIILLIACANVAHILVARADARRPEIAVRLALGSGSRQLARLLLIEVGCLAIVSGVVAMLIAAWSTTAVQALLLERASPRSFLLGGRVLGVGAAVTLLTILLCSFLPLRDVSRVDLRVLLRADGIAGSHGHPWLRTGLLAGQVALASVLLVAAGLFVRSMLNAQKLEFGFRHDRLLIVEPDLRGNDHDELLVRGVYERLQQRAMSLPGIVQVAVGSTLPMRYQTGGAVFAPDREPPPPFREGPYYNAVSPEYFATMGIPILRGRGFTPADRLGSGRVIVVSETLARIIWNDEDPLGRCAQVDSHRECAEVIGIAPDTRRLQLEETPAGQYYVPLRQHDGSPRVLFLRTSGEPETMVGIVRRELQASAAALPLLRVRPFHELVDAKTRPWRVSSTLFSIFGLLALGLAIIGMYAVTAYRVRQRTREVGIRLAMGARRRDIVRLLVGQTVRAAVLGVLAGSLAAPAVGHAISSQLLGVRASDPVVLACVTITMIGTAAIGSYLAARRAARLEPLTALRDG